MFDSVLCKGILQFHNLSAPGGGYDMVIMTSISSMFTLAFTYRTVCHKAMHKFWANFGSRFSWREVPVESLHHQVPIKGTKMPSNACRKKTTCWETTPKLTPKCWETCYNSLKIWTNPPTPDLFNFYSSPSSVCVFQICATGPRKRNPGQRIHWPWTKQIESGNKSHPKLNRS